MLEEISVSEALWYIKSHPELFREVFYERQVNNVYLDTYDYKNFHDNLIGSAERLKARIRWYGVLHCKNVTAQLELKIKQGLLGEKQSWKITDFSLGQALNSAQLNVLLHNSDTPQPLLLNLTQLEPALVNLYTRRYFLSSDGLFRITLDYAMEYYKPLPDGKLTDHSCDSRRIVLELKYDQTTDDQASHISSHFPFRLTKSSKYVSGLALVNQWNC